MEPSGLWRNQSGCCLTHGWSGEHCSAKSSAISRPSSWALATERLEIVHGAEQRVDGVVAAQLGADAERGARIVGAGDQRVVAALAVRHADREDRRQVHDVEAFGLGAFEAGHRRLQRALDDLAGVRVDVGAFGTREELVPCGEAGLRTFHEETLGLAGRDAVAQRVGQMQAGRPVRWSPRRDGPRA